MVLRSCPHSSVSVWRPAVLSPAHPARSQEEEKISSGSPPPWPCLAPCCQHCTRTVSQPRSQAPCENLNCAWWHFCVTIVTQISEVPIRLQNETTWNAIIVWNGPCKHRTSQTANDSFHVSPIMKKCYHICGRLLDNKNVRLLDEQNQRVLFT